MNEPNILNLLRGIQFISMLNSIQPAEVAENVRLSIEDLKVDVDHLDLLVTPRLTVRQLQAIPNFDKDREIVEDILSCYLADVVIDAMRQSGMDPQSVPLEGVLSATLMVEPVQKEALKLLFPLH